MRHLTTKAFVVYHDWKLQRRLHEDESGLTVLAYALGAAFIVVPLAAAMYLFGQSAADSAETELATLID